ncbi:hypothetical protein VPH35_065396 [Triticum aestivum]
MAGARQNQGARGGRYGAGRSRIDTARPPAPVQQQPVAAQVNPVWAPISSPLPSQHAPPISIYAKPPIVPLGASSPSMLHPAMNQIYTGFPTSNYQFPQMAPWMQQPQSHSPYMPP